MGQLDILSNVPLAKNDVVLTELYRNQKWKQALNHCEKRYKKGDKGEYFLFMKAAVLINLSESSRQVQGQQDLIALLSREPPISDSKLLGSIEDFAESIGFENVHVHSIWDRAIAHRPRDEQLLEEWFRRKLEKKDYKTAQKAAMFYQKTFPQKRQPYYWVIVASYLASIALSASPTDKKVFGSIACKFLSKSAADAVTACSSPTNKKDPSQFIRVLKDANDLYLLVLVYRSQALYKDALEILDNPNIGSRSKLGGKAWDLAIEKVELYELCESWDLLWEFCHDLLQDAQLDNLGNPLWVPRAGFDAFGDDWKVWKSFVNATIRLDQVDKKVLVVKVIESYLDHEKSRQNALEALIYYYSLETSSLHTSQDHFRAALDRYFHQYSTRPVGFDALRPYGHHLHPSLRLAFLEHSSAYAFSLQQDSSDSQFARADWISSETTSLALDYSLVVSRVNKSDDIALLEAFINNCIRLFKLSLLVDLDLPPTDQRPGDDAAIMAAMACIHLYHRDHNCKALIRSALLLEILLTTSKHNYLAIVLLVRLYLYLGCVSMAVDHWLKLDVKHVQNQTTIWMLLSRISTLSPGKISIAGGVFDPSEAIWDALSWINKSERVMAQEIGEFLKHENYKGLLKHAQLIENMTASSPRLVFFCEATRLDRFRLTHHCYFNSLAVPLETLRCAETRDLNGFPNREAYGQPRIEEYVQPGPLPKENWIRLHLQVQALTQVLRGIYDIEAERSAALDGLNRFTVMSDLTYEEREMGILVRLLTSVVGCAATDTFISYDVHQFVMIETWIGRIQDCVSLILKDQANTLLLPLSSTLTVPYWNYYHWIYIALDGLDLIQETLETADTIYRPKERSKATWFQERRSVLDKKSRHLFESLRETAVNLRASLDGRDAVRQLVKAGLGWEDDLHEFVGQELRRAVDDGVMEELAARMLSSWRIGLDQVGNFSRGEGRA